MSTVPDTIVLVHGLWMTPRSWEEWVPHYEAKGYKVLTPAYPGFEIEVEALRENPSVIAELTVPEVVAHLGEIIGELEQPPIIMGHSFGGPSRSCSSTAASAPQASPSTAPRPKEFGCALVADQVSLSSIRSPDQAPRRVRVHT